ncbi:hypothetical protein, partial [Citrobacter youngae]|uniref:hypothetical protein n=1 Tax=Citrobacter youngae TaxID=133448 RepID=UPI0019542FE4
RGPSSIALAMGPGENWDSRFIKCKVIVNYLNNFFKSRTFVSIMSKLVRMTNRLCFSCVALE